MKNSGLGLGVNFELCGFKTESSSTLMLITSKNQLEISSHFCLIFEKIKFSAGLGKPVIVLWTNYDKSSCQDVENVNFWRFYHYISCCERFLIFHSTLLIRIKLYVFRQVLREFEAYVPEIAELGVLRRREHFWGFFGVKSPTWHYVHISAS